MVKPAVRAVAVLLAVNVRGLLPEPEMLVGLNDAVTPLGKPGTDKVTLLLKPFTELSEIMLVPLVPCVIATAPGDADRLKSGFETVAAVTMRLNAAV